MLWRDYHAKFQHEWFNTQTKPYHVISSYVKLENLTKFDKKGTLIPRFEFISIFFESGAYCKIAKFTWGPVYFSQNSFLSSN